MRYGYARVSTNHQDLTLQIDALEKADCSVIRKEKVSLVLEPQIFAG